MEWVVKEPNPGDIVRVNMGIYHHYGIFESDDCPAWVTHPSGGRT